MPDLSYAFVADWQKISFANIPGQRGDKVSVIRNPFGLPGKDLGSTKLIGSTTPIPGGRVDNLALTLDGNRLCEIQLFFFRESASL